MNASPSPPPNNTEQSTSTPFNPWQPPKAALEESPAPDQENFDQANSTAPWRAALFAPTIVIGPIACLFMIGAWGWPFVLWAAAAAGVYWLYRRG